MDLLQRVGNVIHMEMMLPGKRLLKNVLFVRLACINTKNIIQIPNIPLIAIIARGMYYL